MKKILSVFFVLLAGIGQAQNLVPNGSFETFNQCPFNTNFIYYSSGWFQPNKIQGFSVNQCSSSDYYNSCGDSTSFVSIPKNYFGFQFARTGNAYIGLALYNHLFNQNGGREYAEVKLNQELDSGKKYNLKYYVSMANNSRYSITKFDAHFSNDSLFSSSIDAMNILVTPQVQYNGRINDTLNWTEVSGSFIATGLEKFLTIGNFHDGALCDSATAQVPTWVNCCYAYYYIDDVSLTEDTITGIEEAFNLDLSIYPNPSNNNVQISSQEIMLEINVVDIRQKIIITLKPNKLNTHIDVSQLEDGIYIVQCKFKNGDVLYKKMVVQH
jgi:OmpA-OmpF porin, OOP family